MKVIKKMDKTERFLSKLTSAQFWMAILTTLGSTALVFYVCKRIEDTAIIVAVATLYFNIWGTIATFYFKRDREKPNV